MDSTIEINEAIVAGEHALEDLSVARHELSVARSLGIVDLLGGGLLTSIFKYGKLRNVRASLERAKSSLVIFSRELKDTDIGAMADMGPLLTALDFMDSTIAEAFVQIKMADADMRLAQAQDRVRQILADLRR